MHWTSLKTLEKKRFSITRLKRVSFVSTQSVVTVSLKRKDSRLRDWNESVVNPEGSHFYAWKEKILDYEIETKLIFGDTCMLLFLEKKRFSITRLKRSVSVDGRRHCSFLKRKDSRLRDWNQVDEFQDVSPDLWLEKKRFSITRLKRSVFSLAYDCRTGAWKEKILDYEIETRICSTEAGIGQMLEKKRFSITRLKQIGTLANRPVSVQAWKEKILDYEIETI